MDKKFLTQDEALAQFGLDAEQFQQLVDDGELRALADRGTWKFRRDEIEGLIQEGLLTAKHPAGDAAASAKLGAGPEDFSFLELDEEALSEGATMVKKSSDLMFDDAEIAIAPEMTDDSSSEVSLVADSASDLPVAESLEEIALAGDEPQPAPVVLEADAAIVADSDSDVKVLEDAASQSGIDLAEGTDHVLAAQDSTVAPISPLSSLGGSDSDVRIADSGISLEGEESALAFEASGMLAGSGIRAHESGVLLRPVDSGISLEADSGLTLEGSNVDSGLTLEGSKVDSGISLEAGDSGIAVDAAPDSGIKLEDDSGIKLGGPDSGMTAPKAQGLADETQPEFEVSDDDFAEPDQTAMIAIDDDDDAMQTLPPTKRAGKKSPSLSETFDTVDEVEDLEIAEDLDAGELDVDAIEDDIADVDEDVLEASDEAFTMEEAGELSEDSLIAASSIPVQKAIATREPAWGIAAIIPVAAVALLLAVNSLMLWDAMSTMWRGNTESAISSGIIEALGGLI